MKRLSLITLTMMLTLGCQRSDADPLDAAAPTAVPRDNATTTRLTSCYEADEWACAVEAAIVAKTNAKRVGMTILKQSFETSFVARVHSQNMVPEGKFNHEGFSKDREAVLNREFPGLTIDFRAENIGWLSDHDGDVEAVAEAFVDMWWKSGGHRKNMLGDFNFIGVGFVRSERGLFVTQIFH